MQPKYSYNEVINYWQSKNINNISDLESILNNFSILFAYNSGVIENDKITYDDTREIFENGQVINYTGDLRTLYEITNQKDCKDYLMTKIIEKVPLSEEFIKKVHKLLTKGTYDETRFNIKKERPGEYKKHEYVTGRNEVGSSPEDVSKDINDLLQEVLNIDKKDNETIIKKAAYFHNVFESIHPFSDGNGRVGRTLVNYILMTNNLPPIIIYNEDKKYYYAALEKFNTEEDLKPTIAFFKYEMEKTWEKSIDSYNGLNKIPALKDINDTL